MWLAILSALSPADACSVLCAAEHAHGLHLPLDGATGVPLDVTPFVSGRAPALLDATEAPVAVEELFEDGLYQLVPVEPLAPFTDHVVVDTETGEVLGTFTTGGDPTADLDLEAPEAPTLVGGYVKRDLWPGRGITASCGGMDQGVWLEVAWPETTGVYEVRVDRAPGGRVELLRTDPEARLGWSAACLSTIPDLAPGEELEIRVRSVALDGGASEWSAPLVATAAEAEGGAGCDTTGGSAGWLALALVGVARVSRRTRG